MQLDLPGTELVLNLIDLKFHILTILSLLSISMILCSYKTEAPLEFTIPLGAQTCKEGETVTFVCEVTEVDQPAKWMKNGIELKPSDKIKMEVDGKIHRLIISPAELDDQSEYTIMIRSAQSTAPLTVEGNIYHHLECMYRTDTLSFDSHRSEITSWKEGLVESQTE